MSASKFKISLVANISLSLFWPYTPSTFWHTISYATQDLKRVVFCNESRGMDSKKSQRLLHNLISTLLLHLLNSRNKRCDLQYNNLNRTYDTILKIPKYNILIDMNIFTHTVLVVFSFFEKTTYCCRARRLSVCPSVCPSVVCGNILFLR